MRTHRQVAKRGLQRRIKLSLNGVLLDASRKPFFVVLSLFGVIEFVALANVLHEINGAVGQSIIIWLAVAVGAILWLIASLRRQRRVPAFWIPDSSGIDAPVGFDQAEWIPAQDIKRVEIHYEYPPLSPRDGWLQLRLKIRGEAESRVILEASRHRYRSIRYWASVLGHRWDVPIVGNRKNLSLAKWGFSKFERAIGIAISAAICVYPLWLMKTQAQMLKWPTTKAKILMFDPNERTTGNAWYANPSIRYEYEVDGQSRESLRLNPSPLNYLRRETFGRDTDGFGTGNVVPCWYNPQYPQVAYVVNSGITIDVILMLLVGVCIASLPVLYPWINGGLKTFDDIVLEER